MKHAFRIGAIAASVTAALLVSGCNDSNTNSNSVEEQPITVQEQASIEGMRILLTNDDSILNSRENGGDGKGLYEIRKALCEAGADVITIGPWGKQSGMGGRIATGGTLTLQEVTPTVDYVSDCSGALNQGIVFGLCEAEGICDSESKSGSPSDTVSLAITRFLPENYWPEGPELVVSGINWGPNPGLALIHSGTVHGAATAHEFGKPALALSEDIDLRCLDDVFYCPSFTEHASFAVELIKYLKSNELLETSETLINVNYPAIHDDEVVKAPKMTVLGTGLLLANVFTGDDASASGGSYGIDFVASTPESRTGADTTALQNNEISVTVMSGDWGADRDQAGLDVINQKVTAIIEKMALDY